MASREHWVENHHCPKYDKTGTAELSQMDDSFDIRVDSLPEGFRVLENKYGVTFYCTSCDVPVVP
jgi:hypothetical protein